jgi:DNA excision repair protein ERCC-3
MSVDEREEVEGEEEEQEVLTFDEDEDDEESAEEAALERDGAHLTHGPSVLTQLSGHRSVIDELFSPEYDFSSTPLRPDAARRPAWVMPDGHVILETFSPLYKAATDFLVAIAEPSSRPHVMHEYQLTPYSLYAAVSIGIDTDDIVAVLASLSKMQLAPSLVKWIRDCTSTHGLVKLVLRKNRYYLEAAEPAALSALLQDDLVRTARIAAIERNEEEERARRAAPVALDDDALDDEEAVMRQMEEEYAAATGQAGETEEEEAEFVMAGGYKASAPIPEALQERRATDRDDRKGHAAQSFEVAISHLNELKHRLVQLDLPALEEYDFRSDTDTPFLAADLKPSTSLRPYQEKSLSKMFGNGRARSGIIVLPCGAGKTLVGVSATVTVKKRAMVLCTSGVAVEQWRQQFLMWTTMKPADISRFTKDLKEPLPECGVTITTYSMLAFSGKRSASALARIDEIRNKDWGLLVMDEVQYMPAKTFRRVLGIVHTQCKLGLTATLVREDDKIADLNFLVGPKLYEANWMDLQKAGHIATVSCHEVWCPMTAEFYAEYLATNDARRRQLLYVCNPNKLRATEFLIKYHEARGDKIIVFSDNIFSLRMYAELLKRPFIYGGVGNTERMRIFSQFRHNPALKTVFLSKVGDNSIDLPAANVLIQVSSHYASRRQEAQRLGRILRPKPRMDSEFNAFFYSVVSKDTTEMFYSSKRQEFLIEQGYSFRVLSDLVSDDDKTLAMSTRRDQLDLLTKVLNSGVSAGDLEEDEEDDITAAAGGRRGAVRRVEGSSLSALSGGAGRRYQELHPLLAKRQREATKFADAAEAQRRVLEKERDYAEQRKVWAAASEERAKRYARLEEKRRREKAERAAAAATSK